MSKTKHIHGNHIHIYTYLFSESFNHIIQGPTKTKLILSYKKTYVTYSMIELVSSLEINDME